MPGWTAGCAPVLPLESTFSAPAAHTAAHTANSCTNRVMEEMGVMLNPHYRLFAARLSTCELLSRARKFILPNQCSNQSELFCGGVCAPKPEVHFNFQKRGHLVRVLLRKCCYVSAKLCTSFRYGGFCMHPCKYCINVLDTLLDHPIESFS